MTQVPAWQHLLQRQLPAVLIGFTATLGVMALKTLTLLEPWELRAYDQMMRSQPGDVWDSPILLVTITEADIQAQKVWPVPDTLLIQALEKIQQSQPKVIALDLFRDLPIRDPAHAGLDNTVQNNLSQYLIAHPNVIALCKVGHGNNPGIKPPAGLLSEQVGFADLPLDTDGVVRRAVLIRTPTPDHPCSTPASLAFQVVQHYLPQRSTFDANEVLKIENQSFPRILPNTGGYQDVDARGYQILINFQKPETLGSQVTLTQVLTNEVPPSLIRDRIVMIGVVAESSHDKFFTPLNNLRFQDSRTSGLVIHAQIVQQILGAINGTQPLIWAWDGFGEWAWVYGWSLLSGVIWLNLYRRRNFLWPALALGFAVVVLVGLSYGVFVVAAGWLPVVPAGLGMVATAVIMTIYQSTRSQSERDILAVSANLASPSVTAPSALPQSNLNPFPSPQTPGTTSTAIYISHEVQPGQEDGINLTVLDETTSLQPPAPYAPASNPSFVNEQTNLAFEPPPSQPAIPSIPGAVESTVLYKSPTNSQPETVLEPQPNLQIPAEAVVEPESHDVLEEDERLQPHNLGLVATAKEPTTGSVSTSISDATPEMEVSEYSGALIPGLLAGRYQVITQLGRGGFGRTYLAEDTHIPLNPVCVVKQLLPSRSDAKFMQMARRLFQREAATLAQVGQHDRIPRLLAYFEENKAFFLVQEYIKGLSLQSELEQQPVFSPAYVKQLLEEILRILVYVHSLNVIHRDIKPSNILRRDPDKQLVLIDFGAVRHIQPEDLAGNDKKFTIAIGTRGYAPSEQMAGRPTFASDIYALGIVAIQALSGFPPSELKTDSMTGELIWHTATPISDTFRAILSQMVRYNFRQRYQSAQAVLDDLVTIQVP